MASIQNDRLIHTFDHHIFFVEKSISFLRKHQEFIKCEEAIVMRALEKYLEDDYNRFLQICNVSRPD